MDIPNQEENINRDLNRTRPKVRPVYLSDKEFVFCERYLATNQIKQSAIEAGYSPKSAGTTGTNLMQRPQIRRYLDERYTQLDSAKIANANEVLEYLTSVMRGEINDQFGLEAPLSERTRAANELLKRLYDVSSKAENSVTIINNIPKKHGNTGKKRKK